MKLLKIFDIGIKIVQKKADEMNKEINEAISKIGQLKYTKKDIEKMIDEVRASSTGYGRKDMRYKDYYDVQKVQGFKYYDPNLEKIC